MTFCITWSRHRSKSLTISKIENHRQNGLNQNATATSHKFHRQSNQECSIFVKNSTFETMNFFMKETEIETH